MKYKLKKDLPWMKAGTIFWLEAGIMHKEGVTLLAECYQTTANYFFGDDFKEDDWIEEVKSREWDIIIDKETGSIVQQGGVVVRVREVLK